jgi:hypothetical protein
VDPPDRLDDEDDDGRRESVGNDGIGGGVARLSVLDPPPDDVEDPPPDDPPEDVVEPDEDEPPLRGTAVWADNTAGTVKAAVTDRTTSERE